MIRIATVTFAAVLATTAAFADETLVAAGAGYKKPLDELAALYEGQSENKVLRTYGNLGQVIAQVTDSGKVMVVCGDESFFATAKEIELGRKAAMGKGQLVVAWRKGLEFSGVSDLEREDLARIGIPDQQKAIYGKAGRQYIDRTGLGDTLNPKLMQVGTVPQVTAYLISGDVDAGFINATDALAAGDKIGGYIEVAQDHYDPLVISCALVEGVAQSPASDGFLDFLATSEAREVLDRHGL